MHTSGSIFIVDSPGFFDSNGPEVDIANGIGIIKALKACKTVRPVILICSGDFEARMKGIKTVATTLFGMIPSI